MMTGRRIQIRILAAVGLLTAAGCTSDVDTLVDGAEVNIPLTFSATTDDGAAVTRTATTTSSVQTDGFGVFASYQRTTGWYPEGKESKLEYLYNEEVTYNGSAWTYTNERYWPNERGTYSGNSTSGFGGTASVTFLAYAPYVKSARTTGITSLPAKSGTSTLIGYKLDDTNENSIDLCIGLCSKDAVGKLEWFGNSTINNITSSEVGKTYLALVRPKSVNTAVPFTFYHALSAIRLQVAGQNPATGYRYALESIEIGKGQFCKSGNVNMMINPVLTGAVAGELSWSDRSGDGELLLGGGTTAGVNTARSIKADLLYNNNASDFTGTSPTHSGMTSTLQYVTSGGADDLFYVIPSNMEIPVEVKYVAINTTDGTVSSGHTASANIVINMASNKRYTINLTLDLVNEKLYTGYATAQMISYSTEAAGGSANEKLYTYPASYFANVHVGDKIVVNYERSNSTGSWLTLFKANVWGYLMTSSDIKKDDTEDTSWEVTITSDMLTELQTNGMRVYTWSSDASNPLTVKNVKLITYPSVTLYEGNNVYSSGWAASDGSNTTILASTLSDKGAKVGDKLIVEWTVNKDKDYTISVTTMSTGTIFINSYNSLTTGAQSSSYSINQTILDNGFYVTARNVTLTKIILQY